MIYHFADCTLDEGCHELYRADQLVTIEPKVFQVLLHLLRHHDRVVRKDELLEQCWPETSVSEAALTRCLAKVRQAIQSSPTGAPIVKTIHRKGYRFMAAVTTAEGITRSEPGHCLPPPPDPGGDPPDKQRRSSRRRAHTVGPPCGRFPRIPPRACATPAWGRTPPVDRAVLYLVRGLPSRQTARSRRPARGGEGAAYAMHRGRPTPGGLCCAVFLGRHPDVLWLSPGAGKRRRASRAGGSELVAGLPTLNARLAPYAGGQIAVQVGVHTGLVIIGETGGGSRQEPLALGEASAVAARLAALALPNTVIVSAATAHLVEGYFVWQALGERQLVGIELRRAHLKGHVSSGPPTIRYGRISRVAF